MKIVYSSKKELKVSDIFCGCVFFNIDNNGNGVGNPLMRIDTTRLVEPEEHINAVDLSTGIVYVYDADHIVCTAKVSVLVE